MSFDQMQISLGLGLILGCGAAVNMVAPPFEQQADDIEQSGAARTLQPTNKDRFHKAILSSKDEGATLIEHLTDIDGGAFADVVIMRFKPGLGTALADAEQMVKKAEFSV